MTTPEDIHTPDHDRESDGSPSIVALFRAGYRALKQPVPPGPTAHNKAVICGALSSPPTKGASDVERNARLEYTSATNGEATHLGNISDNITRCVKALTKECDRIVKSMNPMDIHVRISDDATPISWSSLLQALLIAVVCLGLMAIPLLGIPAYMREFVTTSWVLAVSTAFLGLAMMVALKCLSLAFKSEAAQTRYFMLLCLVAVVLLLGWTTTFAASYGGLIVSEDGGLPPPWLAILLMGFGMLSEPVIGATGWIGIDRILRSHRALVPNAERLALQRTLTPKARELGKLRELGSLIEARRGVHQAREQIHVDQSLAIYWLLRQKRDFFDDDQFFAGVVTAPRTPLPRLP